MKNGFRQSASGSKKEVLKGLQAEVKNLQMALRINQMMTQQLIQQFQNSGKDVQNAITIINDLQYRTLAILEVQGVDMDKLDEVADRMKLKDYNEMSDREDNKKGFTPGDVIKPESTVIITSEAADNKGIFRSKFKLSECGVPELQGLLEGKKVGDKVTTTLNGAEHIVEVVGIREEPVAPTVGDVNLTTEPPTAVAN